MGLPSALLQRRPDVREAEQSLVAANANVGVAKAAFFPQISFTGTFGASSTALTSFLQGPATFWAVGGQLAQPLYRGRQDQDWISPGLGTTAIRPNCSISKPCSRPSEMSSNGLVGYHQSRQFRMKIEEQTATYKESARLANVRFTGGYASFLEVLIIEQQYFTSRAAAGTGLEPEYVQTTSQLYQALGGGWQP